MSLFLHFIHNHFEYISFKIVLCSFILVWFSFSLLWKIVARCLIELIQRLLCPYSNELSTQKPLFCSVYRYSGKCLVLLTSSMCN